MTRGTNTIFFFASLYALVTIQPFMLLLVAFMWYFWEDSKWPSFDSRNFDDKVMNYPLKPWNKGS